MISVTVRQKGLAGDDDRKSWALVTFDRSRAVPTRAVLHRLLHPFLLNLAFICVHRARRMSETPLGGARPERDGGG